MKTALKLLALLLVSTHATADCIILLHGLARTASSMTPVQEKLEENGYTVVNLDYPSRDYTVEELAPLAIDTGLSECAEGEPVHFVTHSLGGILVRQYLENNTLPQLGRVVMLAPPNQGSHVVDKLRDVPAFQALNGPAGAQLGTDQESIPAQLGKVDFEVGIIAGSRTVNPLLSLQLPNPDDGKVSVENTKVEGMADFIVVPHSHPMIMRADFVLEQILVFIERGSFNHEMH